MPTVTVYDNLLDDVVAAAEAWWAVVKAFPKDQAKSEEAANPLWRLLNVAADNCGDNDMPHEADCLLWLSRQKKRPYNSGALFVWFNAEAIKVNLGDQHSDLPANLYDHLEGEAKANHKKFPAFKDAIVAIIEAWKKRNLK